MDSSQQTDFVTLLKLLGDSQRLTLLQYLGNQEYNAGEIAAHLGVKEPTASYHISKLHQAGLIQMRMDGNHRYYRVNKGRIAQFQNYVSRILEPLEVDEMEGDTTWIEELDPQAWSIEEKHVLYSYFEGRKLQSLPRKQLKLIIVLRYLATLFEENVNYNESQVNEILKPVYDDFVTARRELINFGFMRRERGGGQYWLVPEDDD